MKIIVDAMGGDNAPDEIVQGALDAHRLDGVELVLVGRGEEILRVIDKIGLKELPRGIEIVNASEIIDMEDDPTNAVRQKKDSSLTVALNLLRDGRGDALVSAGNTGALLSGATLIVKRIRGLRRAALAPVIPSLSGGFVLIDCGANVECTPEYLLQFAFMGSHYAEDALEITAPRVGLLNNGTERAKGTALQTGAYDLLQEAAEGGHLNFIGNIEASAAMRGECDVLVCDGFTGNVLLKAIEGTASFLMSEFKNMYAKSSVTKFSASLIKKDIYAMRERINPDSVGGTMLLGIAKPVIKAHGGSNATAVCSAVRQAAMATTANTAARLTMTIGRMNISEDEQNT